MAVTLTDIQKVSAAIMPTDAKGNPAPVDGVPSWTTNDPDMLRLEVAPDGMSAEIFALAKLGSTQVLVDADADLGEGIVPLQGILDVTVLASQAVSLEVTTGVPEPA